MLVASTVPVILHRDPGARHRRGAVERRDPGEGVLARPLEVDGEVGDQGAGGHEHRRLAVEQGGAEARAGELDQVQAGAVEGDADDLHRHRPAAAT
ncbi:MAG: hypothetical protein U0802_24195 [Candidatus Binatia bacterium]